MQLKFELILYDVTVQQINHYTTENLVAIDLAILELYNDK